MIARAISQLGLDPSMWDCAGVLAVSQVPTPDFPVFMPGSDIAEDIFKHGVDYYRRTWKRFRVRFPEETSDSFIYMRESDHAVMSR